MSALLSTSVAEREETLLTYATQKSIETGEIPLEEVGASREINR